MLSDVIAFIDNKLDMSWMPTKYGLVDRIRINGKEIPARYSNNEWTHLDDFNEGFCYHRIIGEVISDEIPEEENATCEEYEEKTFPMRFCFVKKRDSFTNDIYTGENILNEITSKIKTSNARTVCLDLGVDIVSILPTSGTSNSYDVFEAEWLGIDITPMDYVLIYVDYEVRIQGKVSCFETICI